MSEREHVEDALPKPQNPKLDQLQSALADARRHLALLNGKYASNRQAITNQEQRVKYWERLVNATEGETWLT